MVLNRIIRLVSFLGCIQILFCGCKSDSSNINSNIEKQGYYCPSNAVVSQYFLNHYLSNSLIKKDSIFRTKDSLGVYWSVLGITESIDSVILDLIEQSGGIDKNGSLLMDPCNSGEFANKLFYDRDFNQRILQKIRDLKRPYLNQSDLILASKVEYILNSYFNAQQFYFDEKRLLNKSYSQTAMELLVIQNTIYTYLLGDMLATKG